MMLLAADSKALALVVEQDEDGWPASGATVTVNVVNQVTGAAIITGQALTLSGAFWGTTWTPSLAGVFAHCRATYYVNGARLGSEDIEVNATASGGGTAPTVEEINTKLVAEHGDGRWGADNSAPTSDPQMREPRRYQTP